MNITLTLSFVFLILSLIGSFVAPSVISIVRLLILSFNVWFLAFPFNDTSTLFASVFIAEASNPSGILVILIFPVATRFSPISPANSFVFNVIVIFWSNDPSFAFDSSNIADEYAISSSSYVDVSALSLLDFAVTPFCAHEEGVSPISNDNTPPLVISE